MRFLIDECLHWSLVGVADRAIHVTKSVIPQCGILLSSGRCARDHGSATAEVQGRGHGADWGGWHCEALAVYLIDHPDAGDVIPGSGGVRKLRWAGKGKGKRGGARIIYLYVVVAARIYLIRCYAKNVKTDLTADEKKQLRQIAANLKGAQ